MRIGIHCHADIAMAQDLLHHLGVYQHTQQQRCGAMPQVMERHVRQSGLLEHPIKHFQDITGIERSPFQSCEDVILLLPVSTSFQPQLKLLYAMLLECFNHKVGQHDLAPPFCSLRFGFDVPTIPGKKVERATNLQKVVFKVNVRILESKQFTPPQTRYQSKHQKNLQTMSTCCFKEFVCLLHRQSLHLTLDETRWRNKITTIARDQIPTHRVIQCLMKHAMNRIDRFWRTSLLRFLPIESQRLLWRELL